MKVRLKETFFTSILCIILIAVFLSSSGCEGTESRKAIDDTVNTVVGMDAVKKEQDIKKKLNDSYMKEQERSIKGLDENGTGPQNGDGGND